MLTFPDHPAKAKGHEMLSDFINYVNENRLKVDSVKITIDGKEYVHDFNDTSKRNTRSISKVVSCIGIFKAIEEGFFTVESPVMPFFGEVEIFNGENRDPLSKLRVKHLLSLTVGHEKGLMLNKDYKRLTPETDYISYILNSDIKHEPGTYFVYNNAATYLLSAIVQKSTGMRLDHWVFETVLRHLDITRPQWEKSGQDICIGATGLYLDNEELHRIGILLLNKGKYLGRQIIDSSWIDLMHKPHVYNPDYKKFTPSRGQCLAKIAYGYHIWVCGDGSEEYPASHYFCDGADGQFLIVAPDKNMVITVLSHERNTDLIYPILCEYLNKVT